MTAGTEDVKLWGVTTSELKKFGRHFKNVNICHLVQYLKKSVLSLCDIYHSVNNR